jgi:hypothetical protein
MLRGDALLPRVRLPCFSHASTVDIQPRLGGLSPASPLMTGPARYDRSSSMSASENSGVNLFVSVTRRV